MAKKKRKVVEQVAKQDNKMDKLVKELEWDGFANNDGIYEACRESVCMGVEDFLREKFPNLTEDQVEEIIGYCCVELTLDEDGLRNSGVLDATDGE